MDVDKPHQLEILREDLVRQQRKSAAKEKRASKNSCQTKRHVNRKLLKNRLQKISGTKKVEASVAAETIMKSKTSQRKK